MSEHSRLTQMLLTGAINRRNFIRGMSALGVTSAMATTMATSLIGSSALAAMPKKGGHMRMAMGHGGTPDVLDPALILNGALTAMHFAITNMLTEINPDGTLRAKLAEEWSASADASTWTFKLRKDVTFHNGKDLTADDVIASINHHRGEDSKSGAKTLVNPITDIKADGKHTVVFSLEAGDADFPFKMGEFNFPIYQANDDGSLDWQSGIGCGAYVLKEFEPGVRAAFERNPNFYMLDERGNFDSCELLTIVDTTTRQNALLSGDVDAIDRVDPKTANLLAKRSGIVVEEEPSKLHYTFEALTNMAPFNDVNVRLAVKYALNREAMLDTMLQGHGIVGNDNPISPAYTFYDPDLEQRTYDPDKAKFHLKKAGLSSLEVGLSAADAAFSGAVDAAVLYKESARPAGINIDVVRESKDGYWSNVWQHKPWCASYWFGTPMPDGIFTIGYAGGAGWNATFWDNTRFNDLLLMARGELNNSRRAEMYAEMQRIVRDDAGTIVPMFANDIFATSDKIGHGKLANNNEVDGRMFFERWWFK
ncbi:MAG: ABC transporter substrate-binding protein [Rhodospirillales bacterium]|jgi:peptide/nickel transport system substrate-binding protein|nr:ABC transporter substrate-binding protein [Rhodospirillales bacterium]